jgi:hypothetical protein
MSKDSETRATFIKSKLQSRLANRDRYFSRAEHVEKMALLGLVEQCDALLFENNIYSDADIARLAEKQTSEECTKECVSESLIDAATFCSNAKPLDADQISRQAQWPGKLELAVNYLAPLKSNRHFDLFPQYPLAEPLVPRAWIDVQPYMPSNLYDFRKYYIKEKRKQRINLIDANTFLQMQADLIRQVFAPRLLKERKQWIAQEVPTFGATDAPIYAQHRKIPHDAKVHIIGDLHSSFASLVSLLTFLHGEGALPMLDSFTLSPKHFVVFLGDVVDRGDFSIELLFIVGQLLLANPDAVFFLQGNHEECSTFKYYTLLQEVMQKFDQSQESALAFLYFLNYLPTALFLTFDEIPPFIDDQVVPPTPSAVRTVQFCHGAATDNEREQIILKKLLDLQSTATQPPTYALLRYWLNGRQDVCEPSRSDVVNDNLKWGDFETTPDERLERAANFVASQSAKPGEPKYFSLARLLEQGDIAVNEKRGGGSLRVFGSFYVEKYLRKVGACAIISGHQDQTNFAFLPPSGTAVDMERFELDARYGKNHGQLYRPRGYDDIAKKLISLGEQESVVYTAILYPGKDFIAVNTSSAYSSRFNEASLKLDCLLTLKQYR